MSDGEQKGSFNFTDKLEDNNITLNPDTRLSSLNKPEVRAISNRVIPSSHSNLTILKEIKYLNQLSQLDRMKCQTACMQGIIRGYAIHDLSVYIKAKTKFQLSYRAVEQLIKIIKAEDRKWYYYMARDNFEYVSVYRKAITSIEEYQREIWLLTISPNSDNDTKLNCYKELHNLTKTLVLLLRDLPFITQLSKYYDIDKITSEYADKLRNGKLEKDPIESRVESKSMGFNPIRRLANQTRNISAKESGLYHNQITIDNDEALQTKGEFDSLNVNIAHRILNDIKSKQGIQHDKQGKITDEVNEDMQNQMDGINPSDIEMAKKLQEHTALEHHLAKIDEEIDNLGGIDNIPNNEKLKEILNKYESSLSFLDAFMTDEQRDAVRTARQLKEDK